MIGEHLGKWSVYSELGRGGMGRVYLAREELTGRLGAVKVLAPELAQDAGFRERFQQEVATLNKLDHPNIVRLYDSGVQNELFYYVMEYVDGESLEQVLLRDKRLPFDDVLEIALQVCPALKHAHDHGIIHRDLKPGNLLRNTAGQIKLGDFGIAKVFASGQLTATGAVVGTAEYLAPEQAEGKPATVRSDLYSLGVVLYLLLTGRLPFEGKTPLELLHKHRFAMFDAPQKLVRDLPYELNDLVCQLLEKDPSKRPPNALVLSRELAKIKKKLERKGEQTEAWLPSGRTSADSSSSIAPERDEGPATLMSRMVRQELERQQRGGALKRLLNHPLVLVTALVLCIAGVAFALWPPSAETLFERGSELMQSDSIADWKRAFADYFDPLEQRFPDHEHRQEVEQFRQKLAAALREDGSAPPGEAERFYAQAEWLKKAGDLRGAQRIWSRLVAVFARVPSEQHWVDEAQKQLRMLDQMTQDPSRWRSVRTALDKAAQLSREGKHQEAERIWSGIEALYGDDPSAAAIVQDARHAREQASKQK